MKLLDIAAQYKRGKLKLEEIPRGIRKRVQSISSDPSVDLTGYGESNPPRHDTLTRTPTNRVLS